MLILVKHKKCRNEREQWRKTEQTRRTVEIFFFIVCLIKKKTSFK